MNVLQLVFAIIIGLSLFAELRLFRAVYATGNGKVRVSALGRLDAVLVGCFVMYILLQCLANSSSPRLIDLRSVNIERIVAATLSQWLIVLALITLALRIRGASFAETFGFDRLPTLQAVSFGVLLLIVALPLVYGSSALVSGWLNLHHQEDAQEIMQIFESAHSPAERIPIILLAVVVAPLAEELVFRGYLYGVMKKLLGPVPALVLTSGLFALVHLHIPSLVPLFLLACAFTLAYEATGTLLVPMTMHAAFNTLSLVFVLFLPT